ncbi:OPT family oligopeptide transporter [Rubrobacter aplysinae]|uniref:OPT family oligopeptide transporter n=1 Tax=Rubrobacter aplysinae TaxID=909625 RepID=UPI00064C29BC|nr:oligopeptide transporter, OPT family [Rubrobacter aplysinae]
MSQEEGSRREALEEPYIPASQSLPEITVKAIALCILLSALLAAANAYLGLKVGLTVSASIPAAVISMAVLRFFREHNILENNIVQTSASAGEALAAGVIFTLPALVLLGYWQSFEFLPVAAIALCGGVLGVIFTIPLRRALIINARLRFPEGVATGEVLKSGTEGGQGARNVALAGVAAALLNLCQTGFGVVSSTVAGGFSAGRAVFGVGSGLGVALLGVGYIVGINIAVLVFLGGAVAWLVGIPLYTAFADPAAISELTGGAGGYAAAEAIWSERIRYLGVGAMAVGGVWALVSVFRPVIDGVRSSIEAVRRARRGEDTGLARTDRDTPINILLYGTLALTVPIFLVFLLVVDPAALGIGGGSYALVIIFGVVFAFVAGFLFSSVAGYMAGLVGSSNNPISGVTIATVLAVSLILLALLGGQIDLGVDSSEATAAAATAILVAGVVCCAAAIAGDNMQDLKAGNIVGATPFKQQIVQIVGVVTAALCIAPILAVLYQAYGLGDSLPRAGMDPSQALQAPQATLMASVSRGVLGGGLPWGMFAVGAALAAAIIAVDQTLAQRGANFRTPVLAVAVGLYLPLELSVPIFIGGLVSYLVGRRLADRGETSTSRGGILFASGLITGEALMGILLAIPFAAAQSAEILLIAPDTPAFTLIANVLGVALFAVFAFWLYRVATGRR